MKYNILTLLSLPFLVHGDCFLSLENDNIVAEHILGSDYQAWSLNRELTSDLDPYWDWSTKVLR